MGILGRYIVRNDHGITENTRKSEEREGERYWHGIAMRVNERLNDANISKPLYLSYLYISRGIIQLGSRQSRPLHFLTASLG